tara:strand:- start:199 stop:381 length:183 start_codon:yes stop_codon:yes gene_type:complete
MKKFIFSRSAIISEAYVIEAETEAEARDIIQDNSDQLVVESEFLDWYTDDFVLDYVKEID